MTTLTQGTIAVTGAARGLGLEFVKQLSDDPQNFITAVVRNPETSTMLKPLLGSKVVAVKGDIANLDSLPGLAEAIAKAGDGKVDVLFNNAGVMSGAGASFELGISKSTHQEWENQFKVNVTGFKDKGFTFLALNPGWVNTELAGEGSGAYAPLQPEESISRCLSFVNRSTTADSGKFWSLDGRPEAVTQ